MAIAAKGLICLLQCGDFAMLLWYQDIFIYDALTNLLTKAPSDCQIKLTEMASFHSKSFLFYQTEILNKTSSILRANKKCCYLLKY